MYLVLSSCGTVAEDIHRCPHTYALYAKQCLSSIKDLGKRKKRQIHPSDQKKASICGLMSSSSSPVKELMTTITARREDS